MKTFNNPYTRHVPCGSYSGYGTARDLAKLMGIMANGGTDDGKSYISVNTMKLLSEILVEGQDQVMGVVSPYGRGTYPYLNQLVMHRFNTVSLGGRNQGGSRIWLRRAPKFLSVFADEAQ